MAESGLTRLVSPGTHRTVWTLSKPPDPATWEVPGEVEIQGLRQPRGAVYGAAPVDWTSSKGGGSRQAGFPQHFDYPVVYGELTGGLDVVLLDAHLVVHGEEARTGFMSFKGANAYFDAWAALVGRGAPQAGPILVSSGTIQVPHLEALAGASPIEEVRMPAENLYETLKPEFAATINKGSFQQWRDDHAEVTLHYHISAQVFGSYSFGLTFSPVVEVELNQPISLAEFLTEWAWPLRGLVAAATGRRVDITYLTCSLAQDGPRRPELRQQFQVFNASITQEPYASSNSLEDKDISAIRLAAEDDSLLTYLRRWQDLRAAENPILNTYDITAVGPGQHPRARYLLLLQALEGLCGHENRFGERRSRYTFERESIIGQCKDQLEATVFTFVKRYLPKRPPLGLDSVLREMLRSLPIDVEPDLADSSLVRSVRQENDAVTSTLDAIRVARNDLSHGTRTYDRRALTEAANILEKVVRGHLLRLLGASTETITSVLSQSR